MGVFEFVIVIVLIGAAGRAAQAYAGRSASGGSNEQIRALEAALQANEARWTQTEEKVADLSEKLHFVEDLLAKPEEHSQLPPSSQ
ncbi:hypothetical protein BH24GEM2_BH24GEM2_17750 [soil metagenome]